MIECDDVLRIIKGYSPPSGLSMRLQLAALSVQSSHSGSTLGDPGSLYRITSELYSSSESESIWDIIFKADHQSNAFEFILSKAVQHKSQLLASMALVAKDANVVVASSVWLSIAVPDLRKSFNHEDAMLMTPDIASLFVNHSINYLIKNRRSKVLFVSFLFCSCLFMMIFPRNLHQYLTRNRPFMPCQN